MACTLFATKTVTVKLLPFDNKSELAVVLDLPEGASLEDTERVAVRGRRHRPRAAGGALHPDLCGHAGTLQFQRARAPLLLCGNRRSSASCRSIWRRARARSRASHEIALDLRERLQGACSCRRARALKVVEVPPGPPVLATLLAEIYGPDSATRRAVAARS